MIFNYILVILWTVFILYWLVSALSSKKNIRIMGWKQMAFLRLILIIVLVIFFKAFAVRDILDYGQAFFSNPIINSIGVIFCLCGISFAIWARIYLGKNWGMPMSVKENPELVTSGPYAYVRHPIYSGFLLAIFGSALVAGVIWLIVFVLAGIHFIYSMHVEEGILTREFPDAYPEYKKRTKRLIPFIF